MSNPEQLNAEQTKQPSDEVLVQVKDEAIEIKTDMLEHVAGGTAGGGGVGHDPP
jgi:hypothetical protein